MSKKLEELLKQKLSVKSSDDFEANFFKKFDAEFGIKEEQKVGFFESIFQSTLFKPTTFAMCLLIAVVVTNKYKNTNKMEYGEIAAITPVLEDLDMLAEMDSETSHDPMELTDEEWNILLSEES